VRFHKVLLPVWFVIHAFSAAAGPFLPSFESCFIANIAPQQEDRAEALKWLKWYQEAADQGFSWAQYNLGRMYDEGNGAAQDYAEAVMWYRKAADQGDAYAQCGLGVMYAEGRGIAQDYVQAHMWFILCAAGAKGREQENAVKSRNANAKKMTPQQIAEARRLAREWKPKQVK